MFLNKDYREMLTALNDAEAEYLIVGAYALAVHGNVRATGDIDIFTAIEGVAFDDAWKHRRETVFDGVKVAALGRGELLANKRASGRPKDLADAAWLEEQAKDD